VAALVTTNEDMYPVVMGIKRLIAGEAYTEWNVVMATAMLGHAAPGAGRHPDAKMVRQGPG
jgi:ABC-type glycerol-3-phosphate transport system permease component